jgi:hypothetical protein
MPMRIISITGALMTIPGLVLTGFTGTSAGAAVARAGRRIPETCAHSANCVAEAWKPRTFPLQRPYYTLDDFGATVTHIRWTHYDKNSARGVGTAYLTQGGGGPHQCSPTIERRCTDDLGRVVIYFYRPGGNGKVYYTRLHMTGQRNNADYGLRHWWRFSFSKTDGGSPAWVPV